MRADLRAGEQHAIAALERLEEQNDALVESLQRVQELADRLRGFKKAWALSGPEVAVMIDKAIKGEL